MNEPLGPCPILREKTPFFKNKISAYFESNRNNINHGDKRPRRNTDITMTDFSQDARA